MCNTHVCTHAHVRCAGAGRGEEDDEEGAEIATQYELQISVEPSLESSKAGAPGLSAVLSIVREKPRSLQVGLLGDRGGKRGAKVVVDGREVKMG